MVEENEVSKKIQNSKGQIKSKRIGRNEKCPCGSGKKYKKCRAVCKNYKS